MILDNEIKKYLKPKTGWVQKLSREGKYYFDGKYFSPHTIRRAFTTGCHQEAVLIKGIVKFAIELIETENEVQNIQNQFLTLKKESNP